MNAVALSLSLALLVFGPPARAQPASPVLPRPTAEQAAWQAMALEMFIHFGPATWENVQHSNLTAPLSAINPEQLDTDQWADVAVSMGAGQIVFVAKHDGGFCWWQTETTDYSVKNTPWRGGKGDVMRDLAASCRKRGLRLGVYLSPADHKLGISVGGRAKTPEEQERYNKIYRQQLTELLSRYGEISEVWFDGSNNVPLGDILRQYAPRAMIFQGPHATIRWVGNEEGAAHYPAWNSLPVEKARSGVATGFDGDPDGDAWQPLECDARVRADWFWSTTNAATLKSVDQLMNIYYRSVGHGAVLLLNQTPDRTGLIPAADARRAAEFGSEIRRRFARSIAQTSGKGSAVELAFDKPTLVDHVISAEDILQGERIREYVLEGFCDGQWKPLCEGSAIGAKKIDHFAPVTATKLRLRVVRSAAEPVLKTFAAYSVWGNNPPPASAAAIATQPYVLWKWSAENVTPQGTTVTIDLPECCRDAGVYVLEFPRTAGSPLDIQSVKLLAEGQPLTKHVVRRERKGSPFFQITITAERTPHQLQITARLPDASARGQGTIFRRVE
jgi:alpha-L-fucosidase